MTPNTPEVGDAGEVESQKKEMVLELHNHKEKVTVVTNFAERIAGAYAENAKGVPAASEIADHWQQFAARWTEWSTYLQNTIAKANGKPDEMKRLQALATHARSLETNLVEQYKQMREAYDTDGELRFNKAFNAFLDGMHTASSEDQYKVLEKRAGECSDLLRQISNKEIVMEIETSIIQPELKRKHSATVTYDEKRRSLSISVAREQNEGPKIDRFPQSSTVDKTALRRQKLDKAKRTLENGKKALSTLREESSTFGAEEKAAFERLIGSVERLQNEMVPGTEEYQELQKEVDEFRKLVAETEGIQAKMKSDNEKFKELQRVTYKRQAKNYQLSQQMWDREFVPRVVQAFNEANALFSFAEENKSNKDAQRLDAICTKARANWVEIRPSEVNVGKAADTENEAKIVKVLEMLEVMEPALKEYQKMISEREAAEPKAMEIPNGIVEMQSMEQYSRYIKSSQPLLLKVHGQHCINCKGQELLTALATIGLETPILSIDGDAFPDLCASLKVTQYPTFIACREGYRYGLQTGYSTGSAETQLRALLARARKP